MPLLVPPFRAGAYVPPEEEAVVSMEPMLRPKSMPMSSRSMSMPMLYESMVKRS
jgi:hypothetical protein